MSDYAIYNIKGSYSMIENTYKFGKNNNICVVRNIIIKIN